MNNVCLLPGCGFAANRGGYCCAEHCREHGRRQRAGIYRRKFGEYTVEAEVERGLTQINRAARNRVKQLLFCLLYGAGVPSDAAKAQKLVKQASDFAKIGIDPYTNSELFPEVVAAIRKSDLLRLKQMANPCAPRISRRAKRVANDVLHNPVYQHLQSEEEEEASAQEVSTCKPNKQLTCN